MKYLKSLNNDKFNTILLDNILGGLLWKVI